MRSSRAGILPGLELGQMGCFGRNQQQVTPEASSSWVNPNSPTPQPRVNGLSPPLSFYQILTFIVLLVLSITSFGIFIPLLPWSLKWIAYVATSGVFLVHLLALHVATTTDPAEFFVWLRIHRIPVPRSDDWSWYQHKICDHYCTICEVTVDNRTEHCSLCDKCIEGYDHHSLWINNCVGNVNYRAFFTSVVSAVIGLMCLMAGLVYFFTLYWVDQKALRTDPHFAKVTEEDTWLLFLPFFPVRTKAPVLLTIGAFMLVLVFFSIMIFGRLLLFHLYLWAKGLTTLEYMEQKQEKTWQESARKVESFVQMEEGLAQKAAVQRKDTSFLVKGKGEDKRSLATELGSSMLYGFINMKACSLPITARDLAGDSLVTSCSLKAGMTHKLPARIQSLLLKGEKTCTSMSNSTNVIQVKKKQAICQMDHLTGKLSKDIEKQAPCGVPQSIPLAASSHGSQVQTGINLCPVLSPEPSCPSAEAFQIGPGTVLHIVVTPPTDDASDSSHEGDLPPV